MRDRARAVVIGGGVGGCSILYWLTRLGWDDVVLVERADLTSGSTFHSAGLVGQLRSSLSLTRMMMDSVDLYRTLTDEVGLETGWREVGSLRLASSEERLEEITRQAGWAKTFGLPLELISPSDAQELFPPMTIDGVRGAAYLPTDGYIDPSQLTFALAEGARRRGAEVNTSTRVTGIRTRRDRVEAVETDRGEIETEIVVNAGGMYAREIGALAGVVVPIVPMAHEYLVLKPSGLPLEMPTMRDPSLLVYFRPESGGLDHGRLRAQLRAVVAGRDPAGLQRQAPGGGLAAVRGADGERHRPRPVARGDGGREAHQRPRGVHTGRRVHPRAVRRPRVLGRGRLLRARARGRGRDGQARRRVDRRGNAVARRLAHGLEALRRRIPVAGAHARPHEGDLRDVLRREVPRPRAGGGPAVAPLVCVRAARGARGRVRREVGLGACELVRAERGDGGRVAAPARMGGEAVVACDRRRARRLPRGGGALRRVVVREDRRVGRGGGRVPRRALREPRRPRRRARDLHPDAQRPWRDRVRLHRHTACRGPVPHRDGHGVRAARPRVDSPARPRTTGRCTSQT